MALVLADRVQETATSPGTGSVNLLGAVTGYRTFLSAIANGNTVYYTIADQYGSNWEVGIGTYSSSGNTLSRTTVLSSSNGGSLTNFSTGSQYVWCDLPSEKSVNLDASGYINAAGNPYLTFSPQASAPTSATGRMWYDSNVDCLAFWTSTGYEVNPGQQVDQVCYNNTGSTIPAGTAVYLSGGSSGNNPYITPAIATSTTTANCVGITGQSIANGATGVVVILGQILNYNTSAWSVGQTLYLSPTTAGALTATQPSSPFYAVRVGFVVSSATNGIIFTSVRNVYTLGSNIISPVAFTAFSTTSNVLQLYGYSSSQIADLIDIWTYSGGTKAFAINSSGAIYAGTWNGSTVGVAYGGTGLSSLTAGYIPYGNGTSAFSSGSTLSFSSNILSVGTAGSSLININYGGTTESSIAFWSNNIATPSGTNNFIIGMDSTANGGGGFVWNRNNSYLKFATNNSERMRISAAGNLLVGTTTDPSGYGATPAIVSVGSVYAGNGPTGGFFTSTYGVNVQNNIWAFGNAQMYGMSYFQATAGSNYKGNPVDTITMNFGTNTSNAAAFQFFNTGALKMTGQPCIVTAMTNNGDQTYTNAYLPFNIVNYNRGGGSYNTGSYYYTIPIAGTYYFACTTYGTASGGAATMYHQIRQNGNNVTQEGGDIYIGTAAGQVSIAPIVAYAIINCAVGDTISVWGSAYNSSALYRVYTGASFFGGWLLG